MKIVQQAVKLEVRNIDCAYGVTSSKHGTLLPNTVRCITCGPSNSGKTNIAFNLFIHPRGMRFHNVYVFSKSMFQLKYVMLGNVFNALSEIGYLTFSENDEVHFSTGNLTQFRHAV